MKRLIPLLSFLLIQLSLMLSAQNTNDIKVIRGERPPIDLHALTEDAYEKGIVLIKFNENSGKQLEDAEIKTDEDGNIRFGFKNIDALCKQFSIGNAAQLFSSIASKNGFTTKHKAWGFDRWYKLKTDDQTDIIALVQAFQKLDEIEIAEPEYKKVPVWKTGAVIQHPDQGKTIPNSKWTPNDPLFDQQWHYHNTGQGGGQPGADIDLLNAWDIEKGNPNVIVAVIDDGIDFNHPDLAANMWAGIGYNFVDNMATVIPGFHGTHVAGTVAAVSNNGYGVAGIAGGSGSGDGVRLMSCQVFRQLSDGSYLAGGFEAAFVYAADHGAAISQNSWTYGISFTYNSALSDAIDYFEINGGGIAINGGVSVFAAGNSSSAVPHFPAVYPSVLAVAATDASDQKSSFSNFGYWIDISAPGSLVYSTALNNSYSFASGTSMACPHVSGVAALVASHAFGQLSANEVKEIILYSTDDHYLVNPDFEGKLGTGRLNANKALLQTIATLNSTPNVSNFQAVSIDPNTNFLSWTNNSNNDDVLIAWSTQAFDGSPTDGVNYTTGQPLQEGVTVLYNGFATELQHQQLNASSPYYYRIWAKSSSLNYASGRSADAVSQSCFPEDQCAYTFRLTSIGNSSWADSYMTVEQGGRTIADLYKFCGLPSFDIQVNLCENELFQLIWHPGTWGDLMGIEIIGPYGNSIFKRPPQSPFPTNHPVLFEGLTDCSTPSCFAPENIEISNHQSSEVTIDWTTTNNQSVVNLEYGPLGYQQGNGTVISGISESPHTLTGLSSATRYEVRLQSDCGNNDLSFWSLPIYFETACTNFDLPVYEDFSNIPYRELPLCWDRYGSTEPPTENWAVWGHDHVWLHHRVGSHANLITPVINQNLNQVRIYFDLTWDNYTGNLQIGTSQHINDDYIFTSLESIPSRLMYDFEPAEKRVIYFESYSGSDQQIAFRYGAENAPNASWVFLDNIVIEEVPLCPEPYDIDLLNNTETTAELAWKQAGTVQEWEIKLGEIGFNPDAEGLLISDITSNPYEIQTLSPASFYQVYIRSSCGQDHSIWSEPIVFSSSPGLLSLPHIENFDDCPVTHLPPGWANIGIGMHNAVVLDGWGTNQSHGVVLKHSYFESTSILVAPGFETPIKNIKLSFKAWANKLNFNIEVGVLQSLNDIHSFQLVDIINIPPDFNYQTYEVNFSDLEGINGYIALKIQGDRDEYKTVFLDNFQFSSNLPFNCGETITFPYKSEVVTYGTVYRNGLCWLDRNLGAGRVPNNMIDNEGYGDLFQWGRLDDGHQSRISNTAEGPTASYIPGHGDFITATMNYGNWLSPPNFELWQGDGSLNNPCPEGWRLPTITELEAEKDSWSENNISGAYQSTLKWPLSGRRSFTGELLLIDEYMLVWSSTQDGPGQSEPQILYSQVAWAGIAGTAKANGSSVRCVRESLPTPKTLTSKILLEGAFNGSNGMHASLKTAGMIPLAQPYNTSPWDYNGSESVAAIPADVVDWVLVELRDADSPENASAATTLSGWPKAMFLKNTGSIVGLDGNPPNIGNPVVNNNLYIVVRHRNHLDVMSAAPLVLSGNTYSYDFTDDVTKAYGGAAGYKQIGTGMYGMVSGDIDADGAVFASDFNIWAINFGLTTVYLPADVDMDGQVFASDFNKWAVNFGTNTGDKQKVHYQSQVP